MVYFGLTDMLQTLNIDWLIIWRRINCIATYNYFLVFHQKACQNWREMWVIVNKKIEEDLFSPKMLSPFLMPFFVSLALKITFCFIFYWIWNLKLVRKLLLWHVYLNIFIIKRVLFQDYIAVTCKWFPCFQD